MHKFYVIYYMGGTYAAKSKAEAFRIADLEPSTSGLWRTIKARDAGAARLHIGFAKSDWRPFTTTRQGNVRRETIAERVVQ